MNSPRKNRPQVSRRPLLAKLISLALLIWPSKGLLGQSARNPLPVFVQRIDAPARADFRFFQPGDGRLYLVFTNPQAAALMLASSPDEGFTWSQPSALISTGGQDANVTGKARPPRGCLSRLRSLAQAVFG